MSIIRNIFIKKYCKNCGHVKLLELTTQQLQKENRCLQNSTINLTMLKKLIVFNSKSENIVRIEENENGYFIITVETFYKFNGVLSEINFYGYVLNEHKERPACVMKLFSHVIYDNNLNIVNGLYIDDIIGESNKGYGSKLLTEFIHYIHHLNAKYIKGELSSVDEIDLNNKALRNHFYKKFGFKINGNHIYLKIKE